MYYYLLYYKDGSLVTPVSCAHAYCCCTFSVYIYIYMPIIGRRCIAVVSVHYEDDIHPHLLSLFVHLVQVA